MARMIKKACLNCGKPMEVRLSDHRRGWGKFCSKSCKAKHQSELMPSGYEISFSDACEWQEGAGWDAHKVWS